MLKNKMVTLRALRREDLEQLYEFNNNLEVEVAGGGDPPLPQSLERLQAEFDASISQGGRDGMTFAIEANGRFIGHCSLFEFHPTNRTCSLGITIGDKEYWGHGYGRSALNLLLDYAFRLQNIRRIHLNVNSTNERAIRSYVACGFLEEGRLRQHVWSDGQYIDLVQMGILRDEWQKQQS